MFNDLEKELSTNFIEYCVFFLFCQIFIIKTHKKRSKYSPFLCSPNQKVVRSTRLYDFLFFFECESIFLSL